VSPREGGAATGDMSDPDDEMTEAAALAALKSADAARVARAAAALWEMWCRSGRADVDLLLRQGVEAIERQELKGAESLFSRIIALVPEFAEGWNKRATVRYLLQEFEAAIDDCRQTLARNPHHFGALSGQGLCHMALSQHREAAAMFRRALEVHPHLGAARQNLAAALGEAVKGNGHA
jgi:tetratricopeptide (TPR) repeat protein